MNTSELRFLFSYNDWANDRTFGSLEQLATEQYERVIGGSFPSIRETAGHLASAEWVWLERWHGVSPRTAAEWSHAPSVATVRQHLSQVAERRSRYAGSLTDADLSRPMAFTRFNGETATLPLDHQFRHLVNHSTYHRGQIAAMIRQVGGTPVGTDLINFKL